VLLFAGLSFTDGSALFLSIIVGICFIVCGLFFKIYAFPFHAWVPDVYEGSPVFTGLFFATVPKVALMALVIRVMFGPFYEF